MWIVARRGVDMCILLLEVMDWNCDGNAAQFMKCEANSKRGCSEVFVPDLNRILVVQNKTSRSTIQYDTGNHVIAY